ncbi:MAG: AraC family transcriptional regulator [Lachnospiraceae bacterium]|nr:AraC family transcriptional regulator [Lachnospiraceae bacterium]
MMTLGATAQESVPHKVNTNLRMYINEEQTNYPSHWHTDIELIYPYVGSYLVNCGARSYHLAEGDILLICPAVIHEIFATSPGTRIYIQADFSKAGSFKEIESAFRAMAPALHIQKAFCPADLYQLLCDWIRDIQKIYFGSAPPVQMSEGREGHSLMSFTELEPYGEVEIYSILMQFIALAGKNLTRLQLSPPTFRHAGYRNKNPLNSACVYLSEHFTEEITLEEIAAFAGFSKYHFARIFNDYTGETFYQYLQQKRINFAQTLLSNPLLSVTDIAYQAGFASSTAFTRAFRKSTGFTPTQFRQLNEEKHPLPENAHFANFRSTGSL